MPVSASGLVVSTAETVLAVDPTHPALCNDRWLMLWSVDPLGECTCPAGSIHGTGDHGESIGWPADCGTGPGKHPWAIAKRGGSGWQGYRHGATDAQTMAEAVEAYGPPGSRRRWGMTLSDVMVIDIDSPLAAQGFYRIAQHVPIEKMLGVAKTPRGWHVYLSVPGWTQKAVNACMRSWLTDWHGTDRSKITIKGILLDIRTGEHRYTVWPGEGSIDRHWSRAADFTDAIRNAGYHMPKDRLIADGTKAPWNLPMTPELEAKITSVGADSFRTVTLTYDGTHTDKMRAWNQLTKWCARLARMGPESGRNNRLNATAYYAGAQAIRAGIPADAVIAQLTNAAELCGCPGADATIKSGLSSGLDRIGRDR